jgi:nucleotide-binding universal stress UspA family protein
MPMDATPIPPTDTTKRGHHMLVCVDRSQHSEASLPFVFSIAHTFASSVTLVHVLPQPAPDRVGLRTSDVLDWEIARREAGVDLARLQQQTTLGVGQPVQVRLEQGRPAERIVDLARELAADLIVLSTHREDGVTAYRLGSTVQRVLGLARCSVFIVDASTASRDASPKRVLVPLDGSVRTESVLPTAARIAKASGGELLLVHVVQEPSQTLVLCEPADLALQHQLAAQLELSGHRYLERLRERLDHESTQVRTMVLRHVSARQALLDVAAREHIDLIVVSAHGSACNPAHSFGSVTTDLLTHSQLPMLVLQDLPEQDRSREPSGFPSSPPRVNTSHAAEVE